MVNSKKKVENFAWEKPILKAEFLISVQTSPKVFHMSVVVFIVVVQCPHLLVAFELQIFCFDYENPRLRYIEHHLKIS